MTQHQQGQRAKKYKPGDEFVRHQDLNGFDERLARLESLTALPPLLLNNEVSNPTLALAYPIPEFLFVESLEDAPPYGAARASIVLYRPDDVEDIDAASLSEATTSSDKDDLDEAGFIRGWRDNWDVVIYDVRGVAIHQRDRMFVYRHPYSWDGRWVNVLPNIQGDQYFGTLNYTTKYEITKVKIDLGTENLYAKYRTRFTSNVRAYTTNNDATVGGGFGDGWSIILARKGIYYIEANLYAYRTTQPDHSGGVGTGNQMAERINNASKLSVQLQHKCSNSWITLDEATIEAMPTIAAGGNCHLHGKIQTCYDQDKIRVYVDYSGTSGDWKLQNGQIHIQRYYHDHFDLGVLNAMNSDGDPTANIYDREGGYLETDEYLEGDYDQDWTPAQGPIPKKHNSGYPPDPGGGAHLPFF